MHSTHLRTHSHRNKSFDLSDLCLKNKENLTRGEQRWIGLSLGIDQLRNEPGSTKFIRDNPYKNVVDYIGWAMFVDVY